MRYARARYVFYNRELTYRIYMTDAMKGLAKIEVRYADYVLPKRIKEAPEKIINRISGILQKAGE